MHTIGNRIKEVRKYLQLTQKDFADALGITQANISAIEKNTYNPSVPLVKLICLKYNINESWIFEGIGAMNYFPESWNVETCDGLLKRLEGTKILFDKCIEYSKSDKDKLFVIIESFTRLVSILSYNKLENEKTKKYLNISYQLLDKTENYISSCSSLEKRKSPDYEQLYHLQKLENKLKDDLDDIIKQLSEIFILNAYSTLVE